MSMNLSLGFSIAISLVLLCISGSDCLPVQKRSTLSDSSQQPAWCRDPRPRSSQTSPCNENEKVRRYFLHESNPKGCKKFGICPNDAAQYDGETQYNYFLSFEECQRECMQHVQCPQLTIGENVVVVSDDGLQGWGRKVVFECASGYSLSDNSDRSTRTCQKNGTWSGLAPVCFKQCPAPPAVRHAQIAPSKDQHNQGGNVHYTCKVGYKLRGSAQRTCGPNGEWIGDEPSCGCQGQVSETDKCTSCPEPSPIEHGQVLAPSRSLFAEITYSCYPGYTMVGSQTRVCGENGRWSAEEPTCWKMMIVKEESGEDVTDKVVEVVAGSNNIKFTAVSSSPNPFDGTEPKWTFRAEEETLPFGVKQSDFCLTFDSILMSKEQLGNYSISLGNFTKSFQLDIIEEAGPPPEVPNVVFLNHMVFGDTAEFVCVITGYPIPRIQWYHNDELVTGDDGRTNVEVFPNGAQQMKLAVSTLTILGVVGSDSGSYRCTGDNSAGNVSSVVELEVTGSGDMQKRSVRSVDESAQALMCDLDSSNTVTLLGQVRAQDRQVRNSDDLPTYRVNVKRFLRGSDADSNSRRVRTVVVDAESQTGTESRLRINTDYIFQGRLIDKTLFVSRHNVQRHTPELESLISSSPSLC